MRHEVSTVDDLRAIVGHPSNGVADKVQAVLSSAGRERAEITRPRPG